MWQAPPRFKHQGGVIVSSDLSRAIDMISHAVKNNKVAVLAIHELMGDPKRSVDRCIELARKQLKRERGRKSAKEIAKALKKKGPKIAKRLRKPKSK